MPVLRGIALQAAEVLFHSLIVIEDGNDSEMLNQSEFAESRRWRDAVPPNSTIPHCGVLRQAIHEA